MSNWDLFHADKLEVERNVSSSQLRERASQGELREDDLVRSAGTADAWRRLGDMPGMFDAPASPGAFPGSTATSKPIPSAVILDDLNMPETRAAGPEPALTSILGQDRADLHTQMPGTTRAGDSDLALPVTTEESLNDEPDHLAEDAEAADFTFASRGGREKEEDLDLAAMVDVAFQLILFFLVTASTVYFKSVEIPPPDPEKAKSAQQAVARTVQDLQNDNILVEIDSHGQFLLDHSPVALENLSQQMRALRESTGRTAMLLMADRATPHKFVVQALDAANEISLSIKIGRASAAE
jgi:biopolymer transport protein ExbD